GPKSDVCAEVVNLRVRMIYDDKPNYRLRFFAEHSNPYHFDILLKRVRDFRGGRSSGFLQPGFFRRIGSAESLDAEIDHRAHRNECQGEDGSESPGGQSRTSGRLPGVGSVWRWLRRRRTLGRGRPSPGLQMPALRRGRDGG